jgi:hypothetical protein
MVFIAPSLLASMSRLSLSLWAYVKPQIKACIPVARAVSEVIVKARLHATRSGVAKQCAASAYHACDLLVENSRDKRRSFAQMAVVIDLADKKFGNVSAGDRAVVPIGKRLSMS